MPRSAPRNWFARNTIVVAALALTVAWLVSRNPSQPVQAQTVNYKNFESPQVHPLAMTPDGSRLLAVNTPNATLSVFYVAGNAVTLMAEIPVGLEPVSVAARNNNEVWVVNWLSDSVSVVDLNRFRVTRSFDVGDEPTDVVFAGQEKELAFVCVSGLSAVKVFDPAAPATSPQVLSISAKQPRALARDAAGTQVFVSIFESGNQTTVVPEAQVTANGGPPPPTPAMAAGLPAPPNVSLIVKWNGSGWADETGNAKWSSLIPYTLADIDVVMIDAHTATPAVTASVRGAGTHIGNAVFDPANNRLLVANDEARNLVRFEPNLRGHFLTTRLDSISLGATPSVTATDLNSHIDLNNAAGTDAERANSLALPGDLVRAADGTLYLAATSSAKVGVINSQGAVIARIQVGQGPTGLALNQSRNLLYVLNRFDESISTVDLATRAQIGATPVGFNPEPDTVRNGRRFLYDTSVSAHGDVSCASCHPNGHRDGLVWDLGDPQGQLQPSLGASKYHPMKGPMMTQSLRGIIGTEPFHWRGDRAALSDFNQAFPGLLGGPRQLTAEEMSAFTSFVQTLTYPPNPNENLDRTPPNPATGPNATRGKDLFSSTALDSVAISCNVCHNSNLFGPGTSRLIILSIQGFDPQDLKTPQLRGLYQKVGMVNAPGEQISGFGFSHDGSTDTIFDFFHRKLFIFKNDDQRRDVEQFLMAFDTGTAPAVGLQVTVNGSNKNSADVSARVNLLVSQALAGNCDLVVRGVFNGAPRSFRFVAGLFLSDRKGEQALTASSLLQAADDGAELTFMGVPVGAGIRYSVDRDGDGVLDGDQPKPNAIDTARTFVWQHYLDFLSREPDDPGLAFWTNEITSCGTSQICTQVKRINVSGAYFLSIEFQQTGYLVERMYKAAYGDAPDAISTSGGSHSVLAPVVRFSEFLADVKQIGNGVVVNQGNWQKQLDDNKVAFSQAFVQRARFTDPNAYPTTMSPLAFVTKLANNAGVPANDPDRAKAVDEFAGAAVTVDVAARARALRDVAENSAVFAAEQNRAFVLMQYFGYLRRDPNAGPDSDYTGYDFWLTKLNQFNGDFAAAEMVKAFIDSTEYRRRFGL